jgi:hypothetical protein
MEFNPHNSTVIRLSAQLSELVRQEKTIADEMEWHSNCDVKTLDDDLRQSEDYAAKFLMELASIERDSIINKQQLAATDSQIGTLLNPANWFSKGQAALRSARKELLAIGQKLADSKRLKQKNLEDVISWAAEIEPTSRRYRSIDADKLRNDLVDVRRRLAITKRELDSIAAQKERVDTTLAPLVREIQELESKQNAARTRLSRAENLEQELSSADNSYERAMIHDRCDHELGNGKPRIVMAEEQRKIRRIERDLEKARRRAEEIGRKASRIIETLIIDGNNLCYEGRTFIGLSAIAALAPALSKDHLVVIVFDSAIRRMLQANDSQIQGYLGNDAKVHVVASRQLADETVLELGCANKFTYVLSNDRFADFNDKSVVREGRIIQHEIVNGHVFVPDLGLSAKF